MSWSVHHCTQTMFQPQEILIINPCLCTLCLCFLRGSLSSHPCYIQFITQDSAKIHSPSRRSFHITSTECTQFYRQAPMVTLQQKSLKTPKSPHVLHSFDNKTLKCLSHGTMTGFCPWNVNRRSANNFWVTSLEGNYLISTLSFSFLHIEI